MLVLDREWLAIIPGAMEDDGGLLAPHIHPHPGARVEVWRTLALILRSRKWVRSDTLANICSRALRLTFVGVL